MSALLRQPGGFEGTVSAYETLDPDDFRCEACRGGPIEITVSSQSDRARWVGRLALPIITSTLHRADCEGDKQINATRDQCEDDVAHLGGTAADSAGAILEGTKREPHPGH